MEQQSLADLGRSIQAELETRLHAWNADWPVDALLAATDGQELQRMDAAVQQVAALTEALLALDQWLTRGFLPPTNPADRSAPDALDVPARPYPQSALPPASDVTSAAATRGSTMPTGSSAAAWSAERADQSARPVPPPPTQVQAASSSLLPAGSQPARAAKLGDMPDQPAPTHPAPDARDQPGAARPRLSAASVMPEDQRSELPDPPAADPPPTPPVDQSAETPPASLGSLRDLAHLLATNNPETDAIPGIAAASREVDAQLQHPSNDVPTRPDGAAEQQPGMAQVATPQSQHPLNDMPTPADDGEKIPDAAHPVHVQQRFHSSATLLPPGAGETPPLSEYPADTEQRFPAVEDPTLPVGQSSPPAAPDQPPRTTASPASVETSPVPPELPADMRSTPAPLPDPSAAQPELAINAFDTMQPPDLDRILEALAREIQREYTLFYEDS